MGSKTKASILEIESTLIEPYPGDTKGDSIVVTAKGTADKGETAQQYGQHGLISNPAKNTLGLRLTQGSLDIIIGGLNYSVPLPENMGDTLLFSTDAEGVVKSKVYLKNDGSIDIDVPGDCNIIGNINITGNINVTGGDVVADGISLKNHMHLGNLGYNTGSPLPAGGGVSPPPSTPSADSSGNLKTKDGKTLDNHNHNPGTYANSGGNVTGISGGNN